MSSGRAGKSMLLSEQSAKKQTQLIKGLIGGRYCNEF